MFHEDRKINPKIGKDQYRDNEHDNNYHVNGKVRHNSLSLSPLSLPLSTLSLYPLFLSHSLSEKSYALQTYRFIVCLIFTLFLIFLIHLFIRIITLIGISRKRKKESRHRVGSFHSSIRYWTQGRVLLPIL